MNEGMIGFDTAIRVDRDVLDQLRLEWTEEVNVDDPVWLLVVQWSYSRDASSKEVRGETHCNVKIGTRREPRCSTGTWDQDTRREWTRLLRWVAREEDGCDLATMSARVTGGKNEIHRNVPMDRGGGRGSQ
jgi:hypothetical protein